MDPSPKPRPRRSIRLARGILVTLLALAPIAYAGIALLSAHMLTKSTNHRSRGKAPAGSRAWSVVTGDGLTLRGRLIPSADRRRLVVLVHGMWSSWEHMARLGGDLNRRGYDVLLFDLRGHGQSDPSRLSMGRRERADIRAVMDWALDAGYEPDRVGWVGHSMGASTLLMAAEVMPEIRAAVLDSPYADLPELLKDQLSKHSHLPSVFNPGILLAAHRAYGLRAEEIKPIRSARRWGDRPVLLIHGDADSTVPVRDARRLKLALGETCELVVRPGVEHVEAYKEDRRGYVSRLDRFFRRSLAP